MNTDTPAPTVWSAESAEKYLVAACIPEVIGVSPFIDPARVIDELGEDRKVFQTEWLREVFFKIVYPLSVDHGAGKFDESDVGRGMDRLKIYAPNQASRTALGCEAMIASLLHTVAEHRISGVEPRQSAEGVELAIRQIKDAYAEYLIRQGLRKASGEDPSVAAKTMAKAVEDAEGAKAEVKTEKVTLAEYLDMGGPTPREEQGYLTGLESVDRLFTFQPRRVYTLLGETGLGKTALVGQISEALIMQGLHVVWFSTEMFIRESAQRTISRRTGVPLTDIQLGRTGPDDRERIAKAKAELCASGGDFTFVNAIGRSMPQVAAMLREAGKDRKPDVVVVDHFNDLRRESAREDRDVARDMQIAKGMASEEWGIPVIVVVQPHREGKKRGNLNKYDGKGGGAIEDGSDVYLILSSTDDDGPGQPPLNPQPCRLLVDKNRNGPHGIWADLALNGPCVHFSG